MITKMRWRTVTRDRQLRQRATALILGLGLLLVISMTPATAMADSSEHDAVEVGADVSELDLSPTPCSVARVNVSMTNTGSDPTYADALVDDGGLDVSAHIISSWLPSGYTFTEELQIRTTAETVPGDHEVIVRSGESIATVTVRVIESDVGGNVARTGFPSASSTYGGRPPCGAIDGNRDSEQWDAGIGWSDSTNAEFPDWWQVDFAEPTDIAQIDLHTVNSVALPAAEQGLSDWEIQVPDGENWRTVATVTGNTEGMATSTFAAETTMSVRILCTAANGSYSRIVELEAYSAPNG